MLMAVFMLFKIGVLKLPVLRIYDTYNLKEYAQRLFLRATLKKE
jgi:hypothetical protein